MSCTPTIAVVGGGPAGATASDRLVRAGARVTLFEARADGDKPCGGGIPFRALSEFPELAEPAVNRRIVREVCLYSPSDRMARVPVPQGLHMFRRRELDSYLRQRAEKAGVEYRRTRVRCIRRVSGGGWEIAADDGEHGRFDLLVGADGVQGITRRTVASPHPQRDLTIAFYAYIPRVVRTDVVLKFYNDFDGYLWIFPRADHVSIGICARHRTVGSERLKDELFGFVDQHCPEGRFPETDLKGFFIPSSIEPPAPLNGDEGWALVGDAAGFVDPLTREGIAPAMRSAVEVAARLATEHRLTTPTLPADLRRAHRIRRAFFNETFLESLVRLSAGSTAIRRVLGDLLEGKQPYRGLRRRLIFNALPAGLQAGFGELLAAVRPPRAS